ncbi:MAG: group 1 glycosyl transferase [Parcubacteria group bacterium Gr01-1014_2]|nr:MAG: group 1 glycosyl transferase [Parcubacteria group bacterium Gr01-1014_2]
MVKLLMITGRGSAVDLASGKKGAFYNTFEEFHKYWERIDIICPKIPNPKSQFPNKSQIPISKSFDNVFIHPSPWPLIFQPFWILKKGLQIHRQQKFNFVAVHEYPPFYNGIGARMLWSKIRIPYVLEIFHIPGYPKAASLKEKIYKRFFYLFIKYDCEKAKAVRVMNNQIAEKLVALSIPKSKIKLISAIYIDLDIFKPMSLEKKYDLIFVGRLAKNKGINLLLEALKILRFKFHVSNFKVLIVGDGPLKNSLKSKVESLKLENNVIFYGWAEDSNKVAIFLNQSKFLVMTSYNEGGPRVVAEAMACGVPILATPVGIVADIMKDGQSGRIIKWDAEDIAKKAKSLLFNKLEYQKYSEAAFKIVEIERFERKSAIRNYVEKLQGLI